MKRALLTLAMFLLPLRAFAQEPFSPAPQEQPPAPPPPPSPSPSPSAPASASATPTPYPVAEPEKKWQSIPGARLDAGYAMRRIFDIPMIGADIGAAFGAQPMEHGAFWGDFRVAFGSTDAGLSFWDVHIGGEGEGVIDRLRIGGGVGGFLFGISRATMNQTIRTWGLEARAHIRFDAFQGDGYALFVRAAISAGREFYDDATIWGPTIGAGIDFDLKGKRPE